MNFALDAGEAAGGRTYLLLGTASGVSPGISLPGNMVTLPVNWDDLTNLIVNHLNASLFTDFYGTLDSMGQMNAVFDTNGPVPGMAGYRVSFAYPLQGPPWNFASNPVNIDVVK